MKRCCVTNYYKNAKNKCNEVLPHTSKNGYHQKYIQNPGEIVEKRDLSYNIGGSVNWYCHYEKHTEVP